MPIIKRSCIEAIRQQVNLVDVAGAYTQMKRAGSQWRGLSPFAAEKTPSFFVHPDKNVFMDYSSGNAGDLFRFIQLKENLSFQEAVEMLANRYHIHLEYEDDGQPPERASLRKELLELHEAAADYYHRAFLAEHEQAQAMREYWLNSRKFPMELAKEFRIGVAPTSGEGLIKTLQKKNFSAEAVRQSGLFYLRDNERDYTRAKPRFRGRLMIPICDVQGRVVAFTARQTHLTPEDDPTAQAKYVNSPETPIFSKSHILFGLQHARRHITEGEPFLLVEGQLDCLRCFENGLNSTVAPQGTAITEAQMALLRRYTNKVEVVLDGDSAGQRAALRMLPLALGAGLEVTFLPLPDKTDPDELLRNGGAEALLSLRASRLSAMAFAARTLLPEPGAASAQDKAAALEQCFGLLLKCDSAVVRSDYLLELAHLTRADRSALERDFHFHQQRHAQSERFGAQATDAQSARHGIQTAGFEGVKGKLTSVEEEILFALLHFPQYSRPISEAIDSEWINRTSVGGGLLSRLLAHAHEDIFEGLSHLEPILENEDEREYIYKLVGRFPEVEDPVSFLNMCLKQLFQDYIKHQRQKIAQERTNNPNPTPEQTEHQRNRIIALRELTAQPPPSITAQPPT